MVLVDSSVWIDLLRAGDTAAVRSLRKLLVEERAALAPVIYQEILQGAASIHQLEKLENTFRTLPFLVSRNVIKTHEAAARLYVRCRQVGITPRSPHDCLIACTAIEHAVPLLHDDRDYEALAKVERKLRFHA